MDKKRLILIAALIGLMFVAFNALRGMQSAPTSDPEVRTIVQEIDYTQVLSVSEPMRKGDRVRDGDLKWIDWPTDALTEALIIKDETAEISAMDDLQGALVREPLVPGDPLVMSRFIRAGDAGIMAALLKPGMRAVTVRISVDTAAGGFIQPGDKVDIILQESVQPDLMLGGSGQATFVASTIFENVTVLAIDQAFSTNPEGGAAIAGSNATLELSQGDSERITVAQAKGELSLILRGFARSAASAPTRSKTPNEAEVSIPPLTVYRAGEAQSVAVRGK